MSRYTDIQIELKGKPQTWLITGVAGFIGSNLLEKLLLLEQRVIGLDDFSTGRQANLDEVRSLVGEKLWRRFRFIEGDVCNRESCLRACRGVSYILHQAALGSVPRSLEDPMRTHTSNVDGFISLLVAAREMAVRRIVYASSSAVYGNDPIMPKKEENVGFPLSPYAATKLVDEIYAGVFNHCYGLAVVGLRYFNVFGPRQDPNGAYAAVVPKWFAAILRSEEVAINGDGLTSRDFCYIDNVVQANLLAAVAYESAQHNTFNIACGESTTLLDLFGLIRGEVAVAQPVALNVRPIFRPERPGDVRHSLADIERARRSLGYEPTVTVRDGLKRTFAWHHRAKRA